MVSLSHTDIKWFRYVCKTATAPGRPHDFLGMGFRMPAGLAWMADGTHSWCPSFCEPNPKGDASDPHDTLPDGGQILSVQHRQFAHLRTNSQGRRINMRQKNSAKHFRQSARLTDGGNRPDHANGSTRCSMPARSARAGSQRAEGPAAATCHCRTSCRSCGGPEPTIYLSPYAVKQVYHTRRRCTMSVIPASWVEGFASRLMQLRPSETPLAAVRAATSMFEDSSTLPPKEAAEIFATHSDSSADVRAPTQ
jgi:hypothetical protein